MRKRKNMYVYVPVILMFISCITGCSTAQPDRNSYVYPLRLSEGDRYLTDKENKPFFWVGDAAWSLIVQLNKPEVDYYLDDRYQKGFTVLLVNLIDHKFGSSAPANIYNEPPFSGFPFITPNEAYFLHADYVISAAAQRGIAILLCPLYLGWGFGDEGWGAEVKNARPEDLRSWGQYVGRRYAKYDNIIWCIGGDTDPSPEKDKILACVRGILEYDQRHLFTTHNHPETLTITPWPGEQWLTINNVYSYSTALYEFCKEAYDQKPVMPYFMMESAYENEHNATPQRLRSEAYWPLLCGAMGQIFGNCPIWHFSSTPGWCGAKDWKEQLNYPGSVSMDYLQRLFRSRPWHLLVPDFDHNVMTEGFGQWDNADYVTTAYASDGTTIIAYLPSQKQVTVDMSKITGKNTRCWWYNPDTGLATEIGMFPAIGNQNFNPPSGGDWVLIIDDASSDFPVPGSDRIY